jgi:hypothetical protein
MVLPTGAPPVLMQVAQRFSATNQGVVGFHLHRTFDVHAGLSGRHEDLVMSGIYDAGSIVKVRILSYTIDGKPANGSDQAALQQGYEHPKPGDIPNPPFDSRYLGAYQYQIAGAGTMSFTSSLNDTAHGSGSFSYDAADNVVAYTYQPNVLPRYATSGVVTDRRSEVLSGYWAVTQETQQYKGHYGPFPGTATVQVEFSDFRRFPDLQSAIRAL